MRGSLFWVVGNVVVLRLGGAGDGGCFMVRLKSVGIVLRYLSERTKR